MAEPKFPWFRMSIASVALMSIGYVIMKATTPSPEQTYAAMSPDLRRKVDQNRAARLAMESETRRQVEAQVRSIHDYDAAHNSYGRVYSSKTPTLRNPYGQTVDHSPYDLPTPHPPVPPRPNIPALPCAPSSCCPTCTIHRSYNHALMCTL
ncbi:uncharacterized protein C8Q71DRAFT_200809 [Rhodofomes roseus]|uniref:Uncharacterized protein n=1 Tax=Rhodofomes roseus TaxID=34475 RepID=A0ABQ8KVL7_9APHY|nr:uncharacterized protein C8Q71DRAFT_200809 [Rhodofomes roseus]KAH9842378.1 hypothetical protein C8Q71DRAFT_200809 [Rhodofomes roseus]